MRFMDAGEFTLLGVPAVVTRSGYTGEDGFEISIPEGSAEALTQALLADPAVGPVGLPAELGPWWAASQTFIRWSRLGVWKTLLSLLEGKGSTRDTPIMIGTRVRPHQPATDAGRRVYLQRSEAR